MEKIIYKLKGKEYLLIDRIITSDDSYGLKQINKKLEKLGVIEQGIKSIDRGGFFSNAYVIVKLLVPIDKMKAFNTLWDNK